MNFLSLTKSKVILLNLIGFIIPALLSSCSETEIVLVNNRTIIGATPLVIKCNVYRKKEIGMVSLKVSGNWNASRGKIKFTNGQEVDITVGS